MVHHAIMPNNNSFGKYCIITDWQSLASLKTFWQVEAVLGEFGGVKPRNRDRCMSGENSLS